MSSMDISKSDVNKLYTRNNLVRQIKTNFSD